MAIIGFIGLGNMGGPMAGNLLKGQPRISGYDVAAGAVAAEATAKGLQMLDAPVSGGTIGADSGTLTFMVGGEADAFARAEPILQAMGRTIIHAGASGSGQAAKICN